MEPTAALDQIAIVVKKVAPHESADMTASTRLVEDLGLDSTGILELLMELEQSIGFEVDVDELEPSAFQTLGSLAGYVANATGAG
ncbi:acyl carrier protein [Actinomadura rubrisoli]|uniref:Acyl carrier protein n=1 Tax=Actinomadura rubrisoli TaxID=2530368 RepID=A0A4R5C522_9ACTN|nr:phosphopantetheine-binding protein [Actinomadura rubrisoli]TDD94821.1 acyl carrier protein [Actinomadura rubrisoli]